MLVKSLEVDVGLTECKLLFICEPGALDLLDALERHEAAEAALDLPAKPPLQNFKLLFEVGELSGHGVLEVQTVS